MADLQAQIDVLKQRLDIIESQLAMLLTATSKPVSAEQEPPKQWTVVDSDDDDRNMCWGCGQYVNDGEKHICSN